MKESILRVPSDTDLARQPEATLDPSDWGAMRALGHRMVEDVMAWLSGMRARPVWQPVPARVKARFRTGVPHTGEGAARVYESFLRDVLPYPLGNIHPRFWGWVNGTGTIEGALAELLAATMNPNVAGLRTSAVYVEEQVLEWMKELLGFPASASGVLLSGGSMANTLGLAAAVQAKAEYDIAREGLAGAPRRMVLYASRETHYSVDKAVRLLGLGSASLRKIAVTDAFQVDLKELASRIKEDRAAGLLPFCVVGNAGTVNTGAFDDLTALADLAAREKLWFHVDGAFGALCALAPETQALVRGMESADSLAFDFHKWLFVPIDAACLFVRDAEVHRASFRLPAEYLTPLERGIGQDGGRFSDLTPELTRPFRALKIWMMLRTHGTDAFARIIAQNVMQARYLERRIAESPELELLAPVPCNVVCFRWVAAGVSEEVLNEVNRELLIRLQESGIAAPSHTVLRGRFAIRVANTNHRTRSADFDLLLKAVRDIGRTVAAERQITNN